MTKTFKSKPSFALRVIWVRHRWSTSQRSRKKLVVRIFTTLILQVTTNSMCRWNSNKILLQPKTEFLPTIHLLGNGSLPMINGVRTFNMPLMRHLNCGQHGIGLINSHLQIYTRHLTKKKSSLIRLLKSVFLIQRAQNGTWLLMVNLFRVQPKLCSPKRTWCRNCCLKKQSNKFSLTCLLRWTRLTVICFTLSNFTFRLRNKCMRRVWV